MPGLLPDVDPDGLLEFSVVYTDRALNHMSKRFTGVMQDILATLKQVYSAHTAVATGASWLSISNASPSAGSTWCPARCISATASIG